jgi:hypothetical protein
VLNPRLVVLGGHFGRLFPLVEPTVRDELDRRGLAAPRALVRVLPAVLGEDAPLLGGADRASGSVTVDSIHQGGGAGVLQAQLVGER